MENNFYNDLDRYRFFAYNVTVEMPAGTGGQRSKDVDILFSDNGIDFVPGGVVINGNMQTGLYVISTWEYTTKGCKARIGSIYTSSSTTTTSFDYCGILFREA